MTDYITPAPGGLVVEARSDRHNTDAEAIPYDEQQRSSRTLAHIGPNGRTTDGFGYAEPPNIHSLDTGGVGDSGHPAGLPRDLRSERTPSNSTKVRRSRSGKKPKQAVGPDDAAPARKRTSRRKPGGLRDSMTQVRFREMVRVAGAGSEPPQPPEIPTFTFGSTQFKMILQIPYRCPTRQSGWVRRAPIEFGWIKLTDAADPRYLGDDKVLNYQGVGSSISCRLNVR